MELYKPKIYAFEKLACWQLARQLAVWTYKATGKFPSEEKFGMVSQMRRAAISIASNLAEGSSRSSKKDQAHFSTMSYSSALELLNQLIICKDLEFISDTFYFDGRDKIEKVTYLIAALRRSQQNT